MTTRQSTVDYIVEQSGGAGFVTSRKMFGEHALYRVGKLVALVCDERLFVKATAAGKAYLGTVKEAPPYPGAKPCFVIAEDTWDDADWLSRPMEVTAAELPMPAPRKPKGKFVKARR